MMILYRTSTGTVRLPEHEMSAVSSGRSRVLDENHVENVSALQYCGSKFGVKENTLNTAVFPTSPRMASIVLTLCTFHIHSAPCDVDAP